MRILFALTYYRPHVSGLTIYVERLARALAADGHEVTVLTSRYAVELASQETLEGVRVVRVPVLLRINKGVVMPTFPLTAHRLIREHDVVSVHLPQFEAGLLSLLGRWNRRPVVLTYHCDLRLPKGLFNRVVDAVVFANNHVGGAFADVVVAYTRDYAESCTFLRHFRRKRVVIPPPVELPTPDPAGIREFEKTHALAGTQRVGFAARLATEKGVEYMLQAIPLIRQHFPRLRVLFAGPYENIVGEESYRRRLQPLLDDCAEQWTFLGTLDPADMAVFYAACDVTVLPSINSTESFGLVQVESMLAGTPVVASDLPGVRVTVQTTGMGKVVPRRNAAALADAVVAVLSDPAAYRRDAAEIAQYCSTRRTTRAYVRLFEEIMR